MKSPNEVKLEIMELICSLRHGSSDDKQFRAALEHNLDRLQASIVENLPEPKASKDYDVMGFEDHYDRGKVNGFNQALKEVLDLLK